MVNISAWANFNNSNCQLCCALAVQNPIFSDPQSVTLGTFQFDGIFIFACWSQLVDSVSNSYFDGSRQFCQIPSRFSFIGYPVHVLIITNSYYYDNIISNIKLLIMMKIF